jgi:hypothetical protein
MTDHCCAAPGRTVENGKIPVRRTGDQPRKTDGDLMKRLTYPLVATAAATLLASCTHPPARPVAAEAGAAHVAAATRAAGSDLQALTVLCKPAPETRASHDEVEKGVATQIARPAPTK